MKRLQTVFSIQASLRGRTVSRSSTNRLSGGTAGTDAVGTIPSTDELSRVDYCGNMVYDRGERRMLLENGYVTFDLQTNTPSYHFYLRDHLGNNRVVMAQNGTVEQVTHYYPFGGVMRESTNPGLQPYKYGGKELDRTSGLDAYDFGARMYFADRLQWGQMDPLCEKYYDVSPYGYCANNPVRYIDEFGDSLSLSGNKDDIKSTLSVYNQGMGGYYQATTDANGNVILNPNNNLDPTKMTDKEKIVYEQLNGIINNNYMTTINVCNNSSDVIIGNASKATVDIGDINKMSNLENSSPVAALMHETNEQSLLQNPNFRPTDPHRVLKAHGTAEGIEHSYTGNIGVENVLDLDKDNSGFLEFHRNNSVIEKKQIDNGNFK